MGFLGAEFEYAAHILVNLHLAQSNQPPSARELAEFQRLPYAYVRKLLGRLGEIGLVAAEEGRSGGWRLRLPADSISLLDVATALAPGDSPFTCREIRARCALWDDANPPRAAIAGTCTIHAAVLRAERRLRDQLARESIGALAEKVTSRYPTFAQSSLPGWFADQVGRRNRATADTT
jgi:Rrf2 family protein